MSARVVQKLNLVPTATKTFPCDRSLSAIWLSPFILLAFLEGCASIPKGQIAYYLPRAQTQVQITQTLSCNAKATELVETVTVTPTTTYMSDMTIGPFPIQPSSLSSGWSDVDLAVTLTDDGRLSGINSSVTGQGKAVIQDFLAVAKAVGIVAAANRAGTYDSKKACTTIADYAAQKPDAKSAPTVTLTYVATLDFVEKPADVVALKDPANAGGTRTTVDFVPDVSSAALYDRLALDIPLLDFALAVKETTKSGAGKWEGGAGGDAALILNSVASVSLEISGPIDNLKKSGTIWKGSVQVPLTSEVNRFPLPIPVASTFGTRKLVLALSPYGSIDKLEYSTSGSAEGADAGSALGAAIAGTLKAPTTAQQASTIQAQADLVYQQQRLTACRADPSTCPGK